MTLNSISDVRMPTIMKVPKIIGHRGVRGHYPENTLRSFESITQFNLQWFEFDIRLAACGTLVAVHDETVDRTTNGHGLVDTLTYEQMQAFSIENTDRIPRLEDILACARANQLSMNVEIKPCTQPLAVVDAMLDVFQHYWSSSDPAPLFSSFSTVLLTHLRNRSAQVAIGICYEYWVEHAIIEAQALGAVSLHFDHQVLTPERVNAIHDAGLLCLCYTVNEKQRAQALWQMGVDSVITDYPDRLQ